MRRSILSLLVLLIATTVFAQSTLDIHVTDQQGGALPGAAITLRHGPAESHAATDVNGDNRFLALTPGEYEIQVAHQGFFASETEFVLKPRQPVVLQIELAARSTVRQNIEVRSADIYLGETAGSRLLTHSEMAALPGTVKRDIPTLSLYTFPGATLSHDNYVHVRGNEVSLQEFINGVSFLENPQQQFSAGLSPEMFETINMVSGSFPAEYGNRFGGIVDMTTRSGHDLRGHGSVELSAGSFKTNDGFAEYGATKGRLGFYASAGGFTSDWYLNPPEPRQLNDFGFGSRASTQLDWRGNRDTFSIFMMGGGTNFELPDLAEDQQVGRNAHRRLRSQTAIANWQHTFSANALLSTSVYERTVDDRLVATTDPFTPFGDGGRHSLTGGIKSDVMLARSKHILKAGVDLTRIRLRERFAFDSRENPLPPEDPPAFNFFGRSLGGQASAYAQDHILLTPNLNLDAGARYDRFDLVDTFAQVSPRLALAYHIPKSATTLHFGYNRYFSPHPLEYVLLANYFGTQAPEPADRVGRVKPYRQHYFEAGLAHEMNPQVSMELSGYYHRGDTPFEYREISVTRLFLPINSARATAYGANVALTLKQLPRIGIAARLQYAYQRTFFYGPASGGFAVGEEIQPGERFLPAFDEPHSGTLDISYRNRWHNFSAGWMLRFGSGTAADNGAIRLPTHTTADFTTGLDFWRHEHDSARLEFNLANMSDDRYEIAKESEETPIQYAPPRIVSGRVRFTF